MKSAAELATAIFANAHQLKRRRSQLKRLAGGIRSELNASQSLELAASDTKVLTAAIGVLEQMAKLCQSAEGICKKREAARASREKIIKRLLAPHLDVLTSIEDRLAIVAAVNEHCLRSGYVATVSDLDFYLDEARNHLTYVLTKDVGKTPEQAVNEAWAKFEEHKQGLIAKWRTCLARIEKSQLHAS